MLHHFSWEPNHNTRGIRIGDGLFIPPIAGAPPIVAMGPRAFACIGGNWFPLEAETVLPTSPNASFKLHWKPVDRVQVAPSPEATRRQLSEPVSDLFLQHDRIPYAWPDHDLLIVGRSPRAHIVLPEPRVSNFHCALLRVGKGVHLTDLGSKNGTRVNHTCTHSALLTEPTHIQIANHEIQLISGKTDMSSSHASLPSKAMNSLLAKIKRIAPCDAPILIQGESGTGKEGIAQCIHRMSRRRGAFIALNSATLQSNLSGSELFGHRAGAFTGAISDRKGAFAAAHRGTLFLDEIAELNSEVQAALLRTIESGEVRPVGATEVITVDVRILCASHRDLASLVVEGKFRSDLFHRLSVLPLTLQPLRNRPEDIEAIADHHLAQLIPPRTLSPSARNKLLKHRWPGNIRELLNVLRRAAIMSEDRVLGPQHLEIQREHSSNASSKTIHEWIIGAYERNQGSVAATAKDLGVHRATIYRHLKARRGHKSPLP